MFVMGCVFDLRILEARSLKEKRSVVKGLMEKMRNRHSMSVVEAGYQDQWDRSSIGCAYAVNNWKDMENKLEQIIQLVESTPQVVIVEMTTDTIKIDK